jgi:chromosome segregation ATPase
MKLKGRGRVSEGVKGTAWEDGGFMCGGASADRETLLNAQVLLCRKREEAVEERERNLARAQSEVEISKLHLEEASLLLQKREKEFTAAANGREPAASNEVKAQSNRGEGDSELQALQAKYRKILQDAERARAEREATLRELNAERQRNAVMRALLNEAAQAADGVSVVRALRLVEAERQVG